MKGVACPRSALEASFCLESGIKRTHPNLAAFSNHPHLTARTMTGSSLGLQRGKSEGN